MITRSGSNPWKCPDAATGTIKLIQRRMDTLEFKEELTRSDIQSVLRMNTLLSDMSNDFKTYHFAIVDQL